MNRDSLAHKDIIAYGYASSASYERVVADRAVRANLEALTDFREHAGALDDGELAYRNVAPYIEAVTTKAT